MTKVIEKKVHREVYTHDQAKADAFANNPEVKKLYDEMEAEYKFKEQLIEARLAAGLNQKELAKLMETQQSAISRWEKEDPFQMSIRQLRKIAHALGKEVEIRII